MADESGSMGVARGRPSASEAGPRAEMLLEAATAVFLAHGYAGASVDRIARAARVSTKTIYARHGGKAGLFSAAIRRMVDDRLARSATLEAGAGPTAEVLGRFARLVHEGAVSAEAVAIQRIVVAEASRFPELGEAFYANGPARGLAALAAYLDAERDAGRLTLDDPAMAAEQFVYMALGDIFRRVLLGVERPPDAGVEGRIDSAVRVFLAAYGTGVDRAGASP